MKNLKFELVLIGFFLIVIRQYSIKVILNSYIYSRSRKNWYRCSKTKYSPIKNLNLAASEPMLGKCVQAKKRMDS